MTGWSAPFIALWFPCSGQKKGRVDPALKHSADLIRLLSGQIGYLAQAVAAAPILWKVELDTS